MGASAGGSRRRVGGVLVAVLAAAALGIAPPAARTVLAATDPLRTEAMATYTLDPASGRVHVAIDITETDLKPNTAQLVYYYVSFGFALQREATSVSVSGGSADRITTRKHDDYVEATVNISQALFYKQSTRFTIRYELVGGKPRSTIPTRVGAAFSTFGVWAWGDKGYSTVEVRTPAGFDTQSSGDPMQATTSATTGTILRASPDDPGKFFAIVTADNGAAYAETRLSLDGGVEIVVQSWPEDAAWKTAVTGTLRDAMPELRSLIGLDWPVVRDLDVRERYTPALEGFAGLFLADAERIDVSEDLDPDVIVHEASHAWFNDGLFMERWIYEGLAEEYAWRALVATGGKAGDAPEEPDLGDPGYGDLEAWTKPAVIRDQETDDRERFGYAAAFWVIHEIAEAAGVDGMRDAFANAAANLTAYPGAGTPETVPAGDNWQRLLDLTEPLGRPDPAAVIDAVRAFVLAPGDEPQLDDRRAARDAYRALLKGADGWLAPWAIRGPMGNWDFETATSRMTDATTVLDLRGRIERRAADLGLTPGPALRAAYEGAKDDLTDVLALAREQLAALDAIAEARVKVEQAPDLVTQVGLLGVDPVARYRGARSAFAADIPSDAIGQAKTASAMVDRAPALGQERLILSGLTAAALLLLLILAVVLVRRRRRLGRERALAAGPITMVDEPATLAHGPAQETVPAPAPAEAYGTLAAHPATDTEPATDQEDGGR
ncbi:MAG: hypothetical protein HYX55_05910 [Chloroflexi bacterium]|nr:hypothetical protein [Chloroflexota bacterium]